MNWPHEFDAVLRLLWGASISMLNAAFSMGSFPSHTQRSLS